jgi:rhamnosyltransferase subunit B
MSRHFVLCPFGSGGDVFPFIGIGKALLARGHRVTLVGIDLFREAVQKAGLSFECFGTEAEFDALAANADLWKPVRGSQLVFQAFAESIPAYLAAIRRAVGDGSAVLVTSGAVFAARILREKSGLPQVVVHLQPAVFLSEYEMPVYLHGTAPLMRALPRWAKRIIKHLPNPLDRAALPGVRAACKAEGIPAPRSVWHEWWHAPDGNVALFPRWFAEPQPDWPEPLYQHAFPLEDLGQQQVLSQELLTFLAAGTAPVVFTPGTGNQHARKFFQTALAVVSQLGLRAIFATRYPEQCLPAELPSHVLSVRYAPFSLLLPHARALVSHGGIGTCSQALAAGIPHLIMALAHDQPDNAERLRRLGVGEGIAPWCFTPERVMEWFKRVQHDADMPARLRRVKDLLMADPQLDQLCEWLESRPNERRRA